MCVCVVPAYPPQHQFILKRVSQSQSACRVSTVTPLGSKEKKNPSLNLISFHYWEIWRRRLRGPLSAAPPARPARHSPWPPAPAGASPPAADAAPGRTRLAHTRTWYSDVVSASYGLDMKQERHSHNTRGRMSVYLVFTFVEAHELCHDLPQELHSQESLEQRPFELAPHALGLLVAPRTVVAAPALSARMHGHRSCTHMSHCTPSH